jgi:hypothetical protein
VDKLKLTVTREAMIMSKPDSTQSLHQTCIVTQKWVNALDAVVMLVVFKSSRLKTRGDILSTI